MVFTSKSRAASVTGEFFIYVLRSFVATLAIQSKELRPAYGALKLVHFRMGR